MPFQGAASRSNVRLAVALTGGMPGKPLHKVELFHGRLSGDIIKKVKPFPLADCNCYNRLIYKTQSLLIVCLSGGQHSRRS